MSSMYLRAGTAVALCLKEVDPCNVARMPCLPLASQAKPAVHSWYLQERARLCKSVSSLSPHFSRQRRCSCSGGSSTSTSTTTTSSSSSSSSDNIGSAMATGMTSTDSMASTSDADDGAAGKAKVLCLHGYMQTGNVFRMRVGSLRKGMKSRCTFEFIDAPFQAASMLTPQQLEQLQSSGGGTGGLSWFKWRDVNPDGRPSKALEYDDFDQTYAAIKQAVLQARPDGLLGFSQGATAVALFLAQLAEEQAAGRDMEVPLPRFAVMCAGFLPRDPRYAELLERARVALPTLFTMGEGDTIITLDRSQALADTFDQPGLYTHAGGHMVPTCSGAFKATLVEFIEGAMANV